MQVTDTEHLVKKTHGRHCILKGHMYVNRKCLILFLLKSPFKYILYTKLDYNTYHQEPYGPLTSDCHFLKFIAMFII